MLIWSKSVCQFLCHYFREFFVVECYVVTVLCFYFLVFKTQQFDKVDLIAG